MGSGGAGKGKTARTAEQKKHAKDVNATRKSQGKATKSVASVSRSKARSQAYHARLSQPVPGENIGTPVQVPPEPPAAPIRNLVTLQEGLVASRDEGEVLPSEQPEATMEAKPIARLSQHVPGENIGAPVQVPPEPPAAPIRNPVTLQEGLVASRDEGEVLPSEQPEATMEAKTVDKPRRPPTRMGASGLPEVPFPDFRAAKSFQGKRLSKPVFLTSIRLIRGLCCYGCNVSFAIGELSSHLFSARHQQICSEIAGGQRCMPR